MDKAFEKFLRSGACGNGKGLKLMHGCAVSFNPRLPDGIINELEAK